MFCEIVAGEGDPLLRLLVIKYMGLINSTYEASIVAYSPDRKLLNWCGRFCVSNGIFGFYIVDSCITTAGYEDSGKEGAISVGDT